jgi:hypothetical protein
MKIMAQLSGYYNTAFSSKDFESIKQKLNFGHPTCQFSIKGIKYHLADFRQSAWVWIGSGTPSSATLMLSQYFGFHPSNQLLICNREKF